MDHRDRGYDSDLRRCRSSDPSSRSILSSPNLHFVTAEVFVAQIFQHSAAVPGLCHFTFSETAAESLDDFSTESSTKMGQSRRSARASASLGRESTEISSPSRCTQITAKNVSSLQLVHYHFRMPASRPSSRVLMRSCVIGRGVETFSISSAIAFAS